MRSVYVWLVLLLCFGSATAQTSSYEKLEAFNLVKANQKLLGLSNDDLSNTLVNSTYKNKFAGTTMVYLQQSYKNIPVYNQILSLAFKNGVLVSKFGTLISMIDSKVNVTSVTPGIDPQSAVLTALASKKLSANQSPQILSVDEQGRKVTFNNMGVSRENITAELMWFPNDLGKGKVKLGWQIYIIQNNSSDYWLINVDATKNEVISEGNLTVYCNWDDPNHAKEHQHHQNSALNNNTKIELPWSSILKGKSTANAENCTKTASPSIVNSASYIVVPYPAESPIHPNGDPVLVTDPWLLSGVNNNATTLKWHSIGTSNFDITRGNNVWAQEDRNNNNGTAATQVTSTIAGGDPLSFNFVPDLTQAPTITTPVPNQQFNVTNLFYWNNIVHDLTYQYGFDEPARNFQADNLGRGGAQNDFVFADAQDGGGTNNANFSTPADGGNGRMQMFIWTAANPDRDGDVDNGIIAHEYAHGISNRLTGNGFSCLQNAEQMGEGWSDYYALMYTQDWANSTLTTGFDVPRGIGTYAANQPTNGLGIRTQRYCTNFVINNRSYASSISTSQHTRGEIWCATLWDMTWGIINQTGNINPNLFNANNNGGNTIALRLVTEAMKLQPCNPGFIDGRDAILQADQILYGGAYRCTILEAFRRRGMGLGASQGSSASVTDQVPSFVNSGNAPLVLLQGGVTSTPEGQNITYINRVTTDACAGFTGFIIRDTLPTNVTYVSGGTYDAANRVVSFNVNQAANSTVDYPFVVNINSGTYFAPVTLLNEDVPSSMPASWTPTTTVPAGGNLWQVSTLQASSAPNSFFSENETVATDKRLQLTTPIALPAGASVYPKLSFSHKYNTEDGWDGGVLEISTNGGTSWTDLGSNMLTNKYNGAFGAGVGNALANRSGFTGSINNFITTTVNLAPFAGQSILLRYRFGSDDNTAGVGTPTGWFVDDINLTNTAAVSMRASLFNASNVRTNFSDSVMLITPNSAPALPVISTQPTNVTACASTTVTFTGAATGTGITYVWEVSTNGGTTWAPVTPAATTTTLTLTNVTVGMNNNRYRLVATNAAGSTTSNAAILTVNAIPNAPTVTTPITYCQGATSVALTATGNGLLWYTTATGGVGSATAPTPSTATAGSTTFYVSQTVNTCESPRASIVVTVNTAPAAPTVTTPVAYCQNATATPLTATGISLLWYTTATGGTGSATAPTPSTATIGSTTFYVSQTVAGCESPRASIVVNVTATTPAPTVTSPVTYCQNATATPLTATGTGLLWYTAATGGTGSATAPTPSTTTVGSTTFYVSQTTSCGEGPRASIVVNVTAPPAAPTVSSPLTYCQGATAPALTATGSNLLWYTTATGGTGSATAPVPSTATIGSITYYVSQTAGCESPRASITVNTVAVPAAPTASSPVTYCQGATATALTATGSNLLWYTTATGGTGSATAPTPLTTTVGSTTFYVSQTTACESPRTAIVVNVTAATAITSQPAAVVTCSGANATFTVAATGTNVTYQWQSATSCAGTFTNIAGANAATYTVNNVTTAMSGTAYRVIVSGTCAPTSITSTCVTLTVNAATTITTQPTDITRCTGTAATFTAAAIGGTISYQWQVSTDGGTTWTNIAGETNATYTIASVTAAMANNRYRALISSSCAANTPTNAAILTVQSAPSITTQPADITSCTTTATFTVVAAGTGIVYQWQLSTDGGTTYTNISGANSATLVIPNLTAAMANYKYRVIVSTTSCGTVTSNSVTARVGLPPVVVLTASPTTAFNPSTQGGLYTTVSPVGNYTYQWTLNGQVLTGITATSITKANGLLNDFGTYQVRVTDAVSGCFGLSNSVTITDIANQRDQLFISPNPTQGLVRVSYYSSVTTPQQRIITVYDAKGARVMSKNFTVAGRYGTMELDLSRMNAGTYTIMLSDALGKRIVSDKVIKY